MLTQTELDQLRTDVSELLPDSCTIQRLTVTTSAEGYPSEGWANAVTGVACRLDPLPLRGQGGEGVQMDKETNLALFQFTCKWNVDIRDGDRVVMNSTNYQILSLHGDHSNRIVKRAIVSKVQNP